MSKLIGEMAEKIFHRLPPFKGRWRILFALNRAHRFFLANPIVLAQLRLDYQMKVDLRSRTEYEAFYTGDYDGDIISTVTSWFESGWTVFDVGANVGFYAVPFAQRLQKLGAGKLWCFEPLPSNFKRLNENLALNRVTGQVVTNNFGLSDQEGAAQLTLREDFESGGETGNAAIVIDDGNDARFKTVSISLKTLDQFVNENSIESLNYIKADIEGHEDLLFQGGWKSIEKFRPIIQAELNQDYLQRKSKNVDDILSLFTNIQYGVWELSDDGRLVPAKATKLRKTFSRDLFLIPKEKLGSLKQRSAQ